MIGGFELSPKETKDLLWAVDHPDEVEDNGWFLRDGALCKTFCWEIPDDGQPFHFLIPDKP